MLIGLRVGGGEIWCGITRGQVRGGGGEGWYWRFGISLRCTSPWGHVFIELSWIDGRRKEVGEDWEMK